MSEGNQQDGRILFTLWLLTFTTASLLVMMITPLLSSIALQPHPAKLAGSQQQS
jgi:hypothetical protein